MITLTDFVHQFFYSEIFVAFLFTALFSSFVFFRSCLIARSEKDQEKLEKKSLGLWLVSGLVVITYLFYIRAFFDLEYQLLNIVFIISFSLIGIIAFISWFDRWKLGQKTLDRFL